MVAAGKCDCQVTILEKEVVVVGDHNFTKLIQQVEILDTLKGSYCCVQDFISLRTWPSSPVHHSTKQHYPLLQKVGGKTVLFICSDGGLTTVFTPVCTVISLDFLVAHNTVPHH